jgi:hypothetical protein
MTRLVASAWCTPSATGWPRRPTWCRGIAVGRASTGSALATGGAYLGGHLAFGDTRTADSEDGADDE